MKRSLSSVFAQTHLPFEVIVIDDGSMDNTSNIKQDFPQIKYIYQQNSGVSSARNLGVKNSSSSWIAFLDSDDEWHPKKLKLQVEFHKNNPDIFMSYTDELWIREGSEVKVPKKYQKYGGEVFDKCLSHCIIAPSSVLIHKKLFNKFGVFDENLEVCEDYDLWLRIASFEKIGLVDEKLIIKYAGHEDQLSFKYWGMDRFRVKSLEKLLGATEVAHPNVLALFGRTTSVVPENSGKGEAKATHPEQIRRANEATHPEQIGRATLVAPNISENKSSHSRILILKELIKKYTLLLKGAIKHDKIADKQTYEKRLKELNNELNQRN